MGTLRHVGFSWAAWCGTGQLEPYKYLPLFLKVAFERNAVGILVGPSVVLKS